MLTLREAIEQARKHVDPLRAFEHVSIISRFHRVQGGEDIVVAAEHIKMVLDELGIESRLEIVKGVLGLHDHWFFSEPRGWKLVAARLERRRSDGGWELIASTEEHPLVAVVHSPAGTVEGRARLHRDPETVDSGVKVAIVERFNSYGYRAASEKGVEGFIATHQKEGIRYYSIFPSPIEPKPRAPAVSVERSKAVRLDGETVRISVEAEYGEPVNPILFARLGEPPYVLLIAHICHPRPGAHDNASGVATVIEALTALARSNLLRGRGVGVAALIVPEYTGTAAAFTRGIVRPEDIVVAVSVDMVGSRLEVTGGSLNIYSSAFSLPSPLDPLLYRALWQLHHPARAFDGPTYPLMGVHALPYSIGSDHDIALSLSIPASIVNEWPDEYYHTSLDTPEKLDPNSLASIGVALAASTAMLAEAIESRRVPQLLQTWVKLLAERVNLDYQSGAAPKESVDALARLVEAGVKATLTRLDKILGRGFGEEWPWRAEVERVAKRGPISQQFMWRMREREEIRMLKSLPDQRRSMYTGLAALVLEATGSIEAARLELLASRYEKPDDKILEAVKRLIES